MARLSAAARREVPKSKFGVPSKAPGPGSYPMPDAKHRSVAKAYAKTEMEAGKLSPSTEHKIIAKANALGGGRKMHGDGDGHWSGK